MVELQTPVEIIETLTKSIEKQRIKKGLKQVDLCKDADVALSTYQKFLYDKKINLTNLIKIMYRLGMWNNLQGLVEYEESKTIEEMRLLQSNKTEKKRIKDKK